MSSEVYARITELLSSGRSFAVALIVKADSGTPRKSGTRMIVHPGGKIEFTIGGGKLEQDTVREAREAISLGESRYLEVEFQEEKAGMICGGRAGVFIEVYGPEHKTVVFGGGHIGLSLSGIFNLTGMPYIIADDRPEFSSRERFPEALEVRHVTYDDPLSGLDITPRTLCVILTHGHRGDKKVLRALLGTPAMYIGMIGSSRKVEILLKELREEGHDTSDKRICAPIGLDIGGETPGEIALSIAAEIQQHIYRSRTAAQKSGK